MQQLPALGPQRIFGLDLMRATSLVLIMVVHGSYLFATHAREIVLGLTPVGVVAVETFFVLSGFLIGQILLKVSEGKLTLQGFLVRRWFRTLPNYYLFLLLNFAIYAWWIGKPIGDWSYFLFAQNLLGPMQVHFFPESWTLAAEEWFYFTTPVLLVLARLALGPGPRGFFTVAIGALLLYPLLRALAVTLGDPHWDDGIRKVVWLRLDTMMYGVLLAGIKCYRPDWWARLGSNLAWVGVGLLVFWFAAFFSVDIQQTDWLKVLTFCIVPAGCAAFLPVLDRWTRAGSPFWDRWITNLSLWSYSMYLLHFLLLVIALHEFSRWTEPSLTWAWVVFLGWAFATGAIGGQVWRRFELPTTNLRERFFKA